MQDIKNGFHNRLQLCELAQIGLFLAVIAASSLLVFGIFSMLATPASIPAAVWTIPAAAIAWTAYLTQKEACERLEAARASNQTTVRELEELVERLCSD